MIALSHEPRTRRPTPLMWARRLLAGALASACAALTAPGALAQADCRALQAQIASLPPTSGDTRAAGAAARQRAELDRTIRYAGSLGCDRRQFLFFGEAPPGQCGPLQQRISNMQSNLARLENAAARPNAQREALMARYNAQCLQQARPRNFFDEIFGVGGGATLPLEDPTETADLDPTPRGGSQAVCVRACDGGFFPISASGRRDPGYLSDLCQAQCPNVQASVYMWSPSRGIEEAVSLDGQPYTSMSNALRFRRTFDAACTCRPAHQSWAEALANAERLISRNQRDVIVTPEKAEELSRPRHVRPAAARARQTETDAPMRAPDRAARPPAQGADVPPFGRPIGAEAASSSRAMRANDPAL